MNQRDLMDAWERALPLGPTGRAVLLLGAADRAAGDLAALQIGVRDRRLLDLHASLFGPDLAATVRCPACGAALELEIPVDGLRADPPSAAPVSHFGGYEIRVRPPDSRDLTAVAGLAPADAEAILVHRCVSIVDGPEELLDQVSAADVEDAMLAADPQSETRLAVTCQPCGHRWSAELDVGAFLWARVDAAARRCAVEVHALAGAYGWAEADILAMSPWRRALYLQMVSP